MNEDFNKSLSAISEKPIVFLLTGHKREGWDGQVVIKPLCPGMFFRINTLISQIEEKDDKIDNVIANYNIIMEIICLAWWNKEGDYPNWYKNALAYSCASISDLELMLKAIIEGMNFTSFTTSTILAKMMGLQK